MSADVTETVTFDLSPTQVLDYVVDFSNLAEWDPMFDEYDRPNHARLVGDAPS